MKKRIIIYIVLIVCLLSLIITNYGEGHTRVYDCRLSEISPDYPTEVKEECRRLRYEQWKQEQDEYDRKRVIRT